MKHSAMKRTIWLVIVMIVIGIVGLLLSRNAFTSDPDLMPTVVEAEGIKYITGGVGESESNMMKALAKDYPLEIILVQRSKEVKNPEDEEISKEEYLADIKIQIQDHHLNNVLDIATDGPYLLADLASGKYRITADHNGSVKQQWVTVDTHNHQKVVFWWPI